jgi:ArsR family transcriptional regulator, arsenate/arsenite/antimonite-responsive transcriptional repressor
MSVHSLPIAGHVGPDFGESPMEAPHALAALAALGQPTRLSIFRLLVRKEPDGLLAGALAEAVGCPHNTLSTHVAILVRAGLVNGTREGRTITYRADPPGTRALIAFLVTDCCDGRPELCGLPGQADEAECGCVPVSQQKKKRKGKVAR